MRNPSELNELYLTIRRELVKASPVPNLEMFLWGRLDAHEVTDPDEIREIMGCFGVDLSK